MSSSNQSDHVTRREFMRSAIQAGGAMASLGGFGALLGCGTACPQNIPTPLHTRRVLADLHVHPMMNEWITQTPVAVRTPLLGTIAKNFFNPTDVTWRTCHQAHIDLLCVAHFNVFDEWLSMPTDPNPEAPTTALRMMDMLEERLLAEDVARYATFARNSQQLRQILNQKGTSNYRVAALHALEGGHALGGSLDSVDIFADRGVALITLTHFFNKGIASSPNAYPFFPDNSSRWPNQGVSEFGCEVIKRMEERGIIVDATHTTSAAMQDVLEVATKPILATHASARTLADHPYSLYDEHIQHIAQKGGIIGVIVYPYILTNYSNDEAAKEHGTLHDVVRSIRYVYKICGTHKNIGLGSDFAGYTVGPKEMSCLGEIDRLRALLLQEFDHDETIVEDIMANNSINFLQQNWKSGNTNADEHS